VNRIPQRTPNRGSLRRITHSKFFEDLTSGTDRPAKPMALVRADDVTGWRAKKFCGFGLQTAARSNAGFVAK